MTTTSLAAATRRLLLISALVVSLLAAAMNIAGAMLDIGVLLFARWLYVLPLIVALIALPAGRRWRGLLWLAGLFFSGVGDTQGGHGFLVLLGAFLVAHVFFIAALWPDRARSLLGRPGSALYGVILVGALAVLVPAVDGVLVAPVVIYAVVLALMAVLAAAAGPVGIAGGLLFMISDLTLGIGMFAVDMPDGIQTLIVIGTYVPAQVLLLLAFLRLADADTRSARDTLKRQPTWRG